MKDCLIQIPLNAPLDYHMSGKFEAPSDDWMHEDFDLTDFELIIMTENVLYTVPTVPVLLHDCPYQERFEHTKDHRSPSTRAAKVLSPDVPMP